MCAVIFILLGVMCLGITLILWRNSYQSMESVYADVEETRWGRTFTSRKHVGYEYTDKIRMPRWGLALLIIGTLVPFVNLAVHICVWIYLIISYYESDLYLHFDDRGIIAKIIEFLEVDAF